jgi:hypothetical protein
LDSSKHLDEKNQSYETGEEIGPPEASAAFVGVASEDCKAGVIPNNSVWNRNLLNRCVDTKNGALSAEHLLNFRLQMGDSRATEEPVTLTKQMKIGLCEQVRVN